MRRGLMTGAAALLCAFALSFGVADEARAQGVTTSAVTGVVTDESGQPLSGVQITVRNEATGAQVGTLTNAQGRYLVPGLRPGGSYTVEAQSIGFATEARTGISLGLGETLPVDFVLGAQAIELEAIEVVSNRTAADASGGVQTVIDEETIENAPTLNREIVDIARLTPQAFVSNEDDDGAAISIAGQNAEYNGLFIDGVVNNDVFGLSAQGTNGGQTGAPPISFDALEQLQIAISPYDVTQSGFTGGAINAITRSGTNEFHGSLYYQLRNESISGDTPGPDFLFEDSERSELPEFSNARYGFRLGGPIVQDKLFFFVNGELFRSETPRPFRPATYRGDSLDRADEVREILQQELGYDPGNFGDQASSLDDNKALAKIDWLINQDHRLSVRHSYSQSDNIDAFGSGGGSINFDNNREVFPNTTHSSALELNSRFGGNITNRLLLGMTFVDDDRNFAGEPFPAVTIDDGSGTFFLGSEPFSTGNILTQDIFSVTNNVNWFLNRHSLTLGAHFEYYDIFNLFVRQNFGDYEYASIDDFLQSVCAAGNGSSTYCQQLAIGFPLGIPFAPVEDFDRGYALVGSGLGDAAEEAAAAFSAYQIGFYVQDDFQATDRLRLTAGLRVDIPKITTDPRFSDDVFETTMPMIEAAGYDLEGAVPGQTPDAQPYFAPRLGFNYDLIEDRATQLRGGLGLFTGRVPFVYPGAMYTNNGVTTGFVSGDELENGDPVPFIADPANGLTAEDFGLPSSPTGELDLFTEDFKYPRIFRTSLGVDTELPYGFLGTIEAQYTKNLDNILVENINYRPQNATLNGPDDRPIYFYGYNSSFNSIDVDETLIDPRYSNGIYKVSSTSEGYAYDVTASLERDFLDDMFTVRASYTYGDSYSLNDATSDQISSTFRFNENVDGLNFLELARSDWSIGHRLLGLLTYRAEFLESLATTISAVYTGESGRPYSFIIGGDNAFMTGEGSGAQPLAFVPTSADQLTFQEFTSGGVTYTVAQQQAAFDAFVAVDDYLSERRGGYTERNASRTPFEHVVDLRLAQELFGELGGRLNSIELTFDIFNFTNLLNDEWGLRYDPGFRTVNLVDFERFVSEDDLTPIYTFRFMSFDGTDEEPGVQSMDEFWETELLDFGTYGSRWLMQVGVRYTF